jgi:hypothetical protein
MKKKSAKEKMNFEHAMKALFRVPKSAVVEKIKKKVKKGKD